MQHHGEHSGMGIGPMRRGVGQRCLQGCVLSEAVTKLLKIEDASRLIHSLSGALDRRKQGQDARDKYAGCHGKIRPAEWNARGDVLEQRERAPPVACDERNGPRSQIGRMFETQAVVDQAINGYPQPINPHELLLVA
jgi:hypothetical protein